MFAPVDTPFFVTVHRWLYVTSSLKLIPSEMVNFESSIWLSLLNKLPLALMIIVRDSSSSEGNPKLNISVAVSM